MTVSIDTQNMQSAAAREYVAYQQAEKPDHLSVETPLQSNAYQAILNSTLPGPEKEPARLAQEILTLLVGGSATSARIMTRTTYHLCSEPALLARLREELKTVMPDPYAMPRLEQLETLPFLVSPSLRTRCFSLRLDGIDPSFV